MSKKYAKASGAACFQSRSFGDVDRIRKHCPLKEFPGQTTRATGNDEAPVSSALETGQPSRSRSVSDSHVHCPQHSETFEFTGREAVCVGARLNRDLRSDFNRARLNRGYCMRKWRTGEGHLHARCKTVRQPRYSRVDEAPRGPAEGQPRRRASSSPLFRLRL